jgi:DNA repair photolyase
VLPGITDSPKQLQAVVRAAAKADACYVYANPLFLKPCSAAVFLPFLKEHFPQLLSDYERRFKERAFLPAAYRKRISELIGKLREKYGMARSTRWQCADKVVAKDAQMELF